MFSLLGHSTFDFLHPLWYGVFALLLTAGLFERNTIGRHWHALLWGAPLMAALDVLENLVHLPLIIGRLEVAALPVAFAAVCATLKWLLAAAFLLVDTGLLLMAAGRHEKPLSS